jgi:hypothetical protein
LYERGDRAARRILPAAGNRRRCRVWVRGHSFREISDLHRRAAISLGAEREWAYVPVRMTDCLACGEKVKPGAAVCRRCRAILDQEKAAKHGVGSGTSKTHEGTTGTDSAETKGRDAWPIRSVAQSDYRVATEPRTKKKQGRRPALGEKFSIGLSDRVEIQSTPRQHDETQEASTEQKQRIGFGSRDVRARAPSDCVQLFDAEEFDIAADEIDR